MRRRIPNLKNLNISKWLRTHKKQRPIAFLLAFGFIGSLVIAFSQAAVTTSTVEPEANNSTITGCIGRISDTTASGNGAIRFGPTNINELGLDSCGKTIPSNNYTPPTNAIYMSPIGADKNSNSVDGNDANDGTIGAPVRTINRAIALVSATRNTIVMRGGEYRDWNSNSTGTAIEYQKKSIILQAYPEESPWFNGSDIAPANTWTSDGSGRWRRPWSTPTFCGGGYYTAVNGLPPFSPNLTVNTKCVYWDAVKGNPNVAGDPQMVFINGQKLIQTPNLSSVTANSGSFYYDWANKTMYIGVDPNGKTVELTARPQALMLDQGSYSIKGIGFKRYGSGAFPEGPTFTSASAVYVNAPTKLTIENSVFTDNAGGTLSLSEPRNNSSITSSVIANNGGTGLGANGSRSKGLRDDFRIEGNVFNANNQENFDMQCSAACGAANVKFANMVGFTTKNNIFENTKGRAVGFWCDVNCTDGVMVNNLVRNNGDRGIFYEISSKGIIASNLVINNNGHGISVYSATTKVYNNTVITDGAKQPLAMAYAIVDDERCKNYGGALCDKYDPGIGPDTSGVEFVNNIAVSLSDGLLVLVAETKPNVGTNTSVEEFFTKFNHNAYHRVSTGRLMYTWKPQEYIRSSAAFFSRTGWDQNAIDLAGGSEPFFVSMTGGDYRVRSSSPAYNSGQPLPLEVANAIGVPASGSAVSRGAITWPR